jgi:transposase
MSGKKTNKSYPKDFKEEAVALVTEQGYSVPEAAKSLGVTTSLLYSWKSKLDKEKAGLSLKEDERDALKRLRREIRNLRMEKAVLKKASAFFAKEMK